jgi:hypothetical protein
VISPISVTNHRTPSSAASLLDAPLPTVISSEVFGVEKSRAVGRARSLDFALRCASGYARNDGVPSDFGKCPLARLNNARLRQFGHQRKVDGEEDPVTFDAKVAEYLSLRVLVALVVGRPDNQVAKRVTVGISGCAHGDAEIGC